MKKLILVLSAIFSFIFCMEVKAEVTVDRVFPYSNGSIDFYFNDIEISDSHTYKWAIEKLESDEPTTYYDVLSPDYTNKQIKITVLSTEDNHLAVLKSTNTAYITIKDDLDNIVVDSYKVDLTLDPFAGFVVEKSVWYGSAPSNAAYEVKAPYGITNENVQFLFEKIEDKDIINNYVDNNKNLSTLNLKSISEKPSDTDTRWKSITDNIQYQYVPTETGLYYLWLKGNGTDIKTVYGYSVIEVGTVTKIEDTPTTDDNENESQTPVTPDNNDEESSIVEEELLGDDVNTELVVVSPSSDKKVLPNNQGYIEKNVIASNPENGEVTVELKLHNAVTKELIQSSEKYEIFLVIDDSGSMLTTISTGETRQEAVNNASKELVKNLIANYSNVKIGIIKFGSSAELMTGLTDDLSTLEKAIENYSSVWGGTNIESGLTLAEQSFSSQSANRMVVLLTDGEPTSSETSVDAEGNYINVDDATKNKLLELDKSGITMISMLTEIDDLDTAEYIFGTSENPTVGKYYYIADADINKIITENIFADISEVVSSDPIYNITITDYFPEDILKYFEFSYVTKPTSGTISDEIEDNKIVFTLDELKGNQSVIISYTLKLKNMKYKSILDKVIKTNEKVVLDYTDIDNNSHNVVLDSSPTVKLSIVEDYVDQPLENPPQTGAIVYSILISIGLISLVGVGFYLKKKNLINKI